MRTSKNKGPLQRHGKLMHVFVGVERPTVSNSAGVSQGREKKIKAP